MRLTQIHSPPILYFRSLRLKKDLKSDDIKFKAGHSVHTIKSDFVMAKSEFDSVFGGKGLLIQPTPTNKPNSTVTIMLFVSILYFVLLRH